jgi:uncharacterized OB-fold protein
MMADNDSAGGNPIDWTRGLPFKAGEWLLGVYQPSPETAGFWEGVKEGKLFLKHCAACKKHFHPRRIACTDCGALDLEWRQASGAGRVYSYSDVHVAPILEFKNSLPYTIGLVELEEGVHMFTRFIAEPGPVRIDAAVSLDFRVLELGQRLPVFVAR